MTDRPYFRHYIFLFCALHALGFLDRYILVSVLPLLSSEFSLSHQEAGALASAFVVGYFLFAPVFGYLGDRYSRPKLMCAGVLLWSLATLTSALSNSYLSLLLSRLFVGIGEAGFTALVPGYVRDREDEPANTNSKLSIFYAAIPIGAALGYISGGYIATALSWQAVFFAGGLPGVLICWLLLKLPDERREQMNPKKTKEGLQQLFSTPALSYAILGYVMSNFALSGVSTFVTSYGKQLSLSLEEINLYFAIVLLLSGFIGSYFGGQLGSAISEKSNNKIRSLFLYSSLAASLSAPFFAIAFYGDSFYLFIAACFLGALFVFASIPTINSVIVFVCPREWVSLAQGITIFFLNLFGALLAPIALGRLADFSSLKFALQSSSCFLILAAVFWLIGARKSVYRPRT